MKLAPFALMALFVWPALLADAEPPVPENSATDRKPEGRSAVNPATESKHTNRLANATSPYLLQHKHNPVDWYEWGEAAFRKAMEEDKPIFLSIGYSACHWCHVMAHESFEDEEVARVLNEHFVSIKVDREERPDVDEIYMAYTQALTGHGGWPMSVWLTPDGAPFHAGTYFPKLQFVQVLQSIANTWQNEKQKILEGAGNAKRFFTQWAAGPEPAEGVPSKETVLRTARHIADYFDMRYGGIPSGPNKFPPTMAMNLLLRAYHRTGESKLFEAVDLTLDHMARGGIYDHIGGGICRYSTDQEWLVPHFEKMLYDQATVSGIYLDGYLVGGNEAYDRTAADTFDYVIRDLQSPEGGFYSARDADSDGMEGAFYIWTVKQVMDVLGEEDGKLFCAYYDVTESGNWFESRGHAPAGPKNILHVTKKPEAFAKLNNMSVDALNSKLSEWRKKMFEAREKRTPPGLDDKVLTAWNGLMIASLARGGRVLDEPKYTQAAVRAADFILARLQKDGRLLRTYREGEARLTGYLDDYAFFTAGLLNLYEATFDRRWLDEAARLTDVCIEHYWDDAGGGFFFTADDAETLLARSKQPHDGAIPSGNSVKTMNLLRLAKFFDRDEYRTKAEQTFRAFAADMERSPGAFDNLLCALDFYHGPVREIGLIGDPADEGTRALIRTVYGRYIPNKVVAGAATPVDESGLPLLARKTPMNDKPTAYVCENYRCQRPVNTPGDLAKQLDELREAATAE